MSIKIKKAQSADAPFLAKMILQSSRADKPFGMFDLIFGHIGDESILANLEKLVQTKAKNQCHFSNFLIADIDGENVGTLCSYEPRISTTESFLDALTEIDLADGHEIFLEITGACSFELNKRTLVFDFMEELEGYMDVGILKSLMQKSLLTARLKGYRIVQSMVEIGSLERLLYYKKLGFKEVKQEECELYREKFGRAGLVLLAFEF
ncbi:MAG: acyl-CoA acyltransferase [Sulfurimonas sp.]|nr:acyl-CoA acyltransferase [Sulfurimonas sp.]